MKKCNFRSPVGDITNSHKYTITMMIKSGMPQSAKKKYIKSTHLRAQEHHKEMSTMEEEPSGPTKRNRGTRGTRVIDKPHQKSKPLHLE